MDLPEATAMIALPLAALMMIFAALMDGTYIARGRTAQINIRSTRIIMACGSVSAGIAMLLLDQGLWVACLAAAPGVTAGEAIAWMVNHARRKENRKQ